MSDPKNRPTSLIVGPGRLSYPHLLQSRENDRGEQRYSTTLLLPPDTDLGPLKAALKAAAVAKFGPDPAKWPRVMRRPEDVITPATDSNSYGPEFEGWSKINCSSASPPDIINAMLEKITAPADVYPGRWARISVNAYGYDNKTKGVTLGLNNVQVLRHDDALAGRRRAVDEFDAIAEDMGGGGGEDDWT
jgi:hypothetical protein